MSEIGGGVQIPLLFQGEPMKCVICGREKQSDSAVNSNWTAIQMGKRIYYVCPLELPLHDRASASDFKRAYAKIFDKVAQLEQQAIKDATPPGWHLLDPLYITSHNSMNPFSGIYCPKCKNQHDIYQGPSRRLNPATDESDYKCAMCGHTWTHRITYD